MLWQKSFVSFWFSLKKVTRTSVAVGLFVTGIVAAFDYIHAETVALKTEKAAVQKTYRNPLMPELNMADPHVMRVGEKYYLYPTSHGKGFDVFVSDDLVNWENKGLAFDDPRRGAWAPDVFHNKRGDGKFYLYYTDSAPKRDDGVRLKQVGVAVATSPLGPFVDKGSLALDAIDGHLFQDDDGKFYFYYVDLFEGFNILVQPMSDPLKKKGEPKEVIRPTEPWEKISGEVTEGPFVLKRNGIYYLMYSGTGADSPDYGIGYATSKSPMGPFVKYAGNPIAQRKENLLGPGHHCVVERPDKKLWMIYHQKRGTEKSFVRYLAIDPIWFDDAGVIRTKISRDTDEVAP